MKEIKTLSACNIQALGEISMASHKCTANVSAIMDKYPQHTLKLIRKCEQETYV